VSECNAALVCATHIDVLAPSHARQFDEFSHSPLTMRCPLMIGKKLRIGREREIFFGMAYMTMVSREICRSGGKQFMLLHNGGANGERKFYSP